ncbi:MAG: diguanylate cyclase [Gammaproteobacteria bacterium]
MRISQESAIVEATLIDDETQNAIQRLRFIAPVELRFRAWHLARNLPRTRASTAIYLGLIVVMTAINMLGAMTPFSESALQPIYVLRIGVACPALALILAATFLEPWQRYFQQIAATSIIVHGVSVMWISAIAAASGNPLFQMGDVLVIVYATLFLGLLFRGVVIAAVGLMVAFLSAGTFLGVPTADLEFAAAVLFATGLMAVLSALRVERLLRANFIETQILNNIAERDGLSGLYNRRMFDTLANRLWQQARRDLEPLQVILVDIDHFKLFNDHYGHQAGDHCIRQVATIIARAAKRPLDFCARYGGEEFALVLYAPSGTEPAALADQIRRETLTLGIPHSHSAAAQVVTVSVGSAIAPPGSKRSLAGLIQAADEALYRAKQSGRNRVLHVDAGDSDTPTGAFKVVAVK